MTSAVEELARRLEVLTTEDLEPGMRLPSEAELGRQFGLSRITVREALKILAGRGLVELTQGRRATVRRPDSGMLARHFRVAARGDQRSALELVEVRQALEVGAATLAARHAGPSAAAAFDAALDGMANAAGEAEYHEADVAFHAALATAGGNRMLAQVLEALEESLRTSFALSYDGQIGAGGSTAPVVAAHRRVAEAVVAGDPARAEQAMRALLSNVELNLKGKPWRA
ncbi:FCD domain-containing protein [Asanoa sp. NPDC050611]|uniref:FadR/GntR family transcriptional regulator n=1 Tax=Asanoa sp. NPDC050611 TaxID=3157098 RepID=UPI0033DAC416